MSDRRSMVRRLLGSPHPELGCEECFEQPDRFVELELAGLDADAAVPGMTAHLDGCPACEEEHESLIAFLRSGDAAATGDADDR